MTGDSESRVAIMLSSEPLSRDPQNHCVPILDSFVDDEDESVSYIVMPFLRLVEEPPMETVGEFIDFVDQILEVHVKILVDMPPLIVLVGPCILA